MRATAQDPDAARLMGINVNNTISLTFLLGGALAGAAGLIYALYETTIWYFQGFQAGLFAFTAAVMGGIGNVRGAVLGGLIIGIIQRCPTTRIGPQWTEAIVFGYLIAIMVLRPQRPARRGDEGGGMSELAAASCANGATPAERLASRRGAAARPWPALGSSRWASCCRLLHRIKQRLPERDDRRRRLRGDGARAERRGRHRRPARPRLRRVLRVRRVHRRLVRLELLLRRHVSTWASRPSASRCPASTSTSC